MNEYKSIYKGRGEDLKIIFNGASVNIHDAKNNLIDDLKILAMYFDDSDLYFESINFMIGEPKGVIPEESFHNSGVIKAKENTSKLRLDSSQNIDSIKAEAELSLEMLNKTLTNSKEEMDEYVKSYNSDL